MTEAQVKFFDSIVTPWRQLNLLLSEHPIAANPDSNTVIAAAQSLVVILNHFRENIPETGGMSFPISNDLRNFANSVKHDKSSETAVRCWLTPSYECVDETFRFIRNEIACSYERAKGVNKDRQFFASEEIWAAIKNYAQVLRVDVSQFAPSESNYGFLSVAVAFSRPKYAAYTQSVRLTTVRKILGGYEQFAPTNVTFVVLGEEALDADLTIMDWGFLKG